MRPGLIVTNNHVVAGAQEIYVGFQDGSRLSATVAGRDVKTDIALAARCAAQAADGRVIRKFGRGEGRRLGACDRQSVRAWRQRDGRHHQRAQPAARRRALRRFHSNGCRDQSRQFGRAAVRYGRACRGLELGADFAVGRIDRHRLCDSLQHGQDDRGAAAAITAACGAAGSAPTCRI